jgi:hypothetical protein
MNAFETAAEFQDASHLALRQSVPERWGERVSRDRPLRSGGWALDRMAGWIF